LADRSQSSCRQDLWSITKEERYVPSLARFLEEKDVGVRQLAAIRLNELGPADKPVVAGLRKALQDSDANVRLVVCEALWQATRDPEALKPVVELLLAWFREYPGSGQEEPSGKLPDTLRYLPMVETDAQNNSHADASDTARLSRSKGVDLPYETINCLKNLSLQETKKFGNRPAAKPKEADTTDKQSLGGRNVDVLGKG
jgi:hypothetical protein